MIVLFSLVWLLLPTQAAVAAADSNSCNVERDDIRLFGSGGDAGRVELCLENNWRYVCANTWTKATATVACRQLGYQSAFMANTATKMAFTGHSGAQAPGVWVAACHGDEQSLRDCELKATTTQDSDVEASTCTLQEAVGAACSTAANHTAQSTYPITVESEVQSHLREMESWWDGELQRRRELIVDENENQQQCSDADLLSEYTKDIPTPFRNVPEIQEAFVFSQAAEQTYKQIDGYFNRTLTKILMMQQQQEQQQLLQAELERAFQKDPDSDDKSLVRWNALGMDLSALFPPPMTLQQVATKLQKSPLLQAIRDLYLANNQHNALHWFLDSPYRYYSEPTVTSTEVDNNDYNHLLASDPSARAMLDTLQRDGILRIDNFGADIDTIVAAAEAALQGEALYRKNETSIAGGGSILTSRRPIAALEELLVHNQTLAAVIQAYLGAGSLLHGYKITRLTTGLTSTDQYNAGLYHHDRVGRRLKLFVFLHDVDCMTGHPTKVAAGTHRLLYYKTEDYPVTRVTDQFVEQHYDIVKGCGQRGGGFLFDTHTLHKGTVQGKHERTVAIAEYHHVAKCAYSQQAGWGIPCPAGDIYRTDRPLGA